MDVKPIPREVLREYTDTEFWFRARIDPAGNGTTVGAEIAAYALALREALEEVAETEPVRRAAEMTDPGRVPCFVSTEWARKIRALLGKETT